MQATESPKKVKTKSPALPRRMIALDVNALAKTWRKNDGAMRLFVRRLQKGTLVQEDVDWLLGDGSLI